MESLFELCRAVVRDAPDLIDIPLPPDGRYQLRETTLRSLSGEVSEVLARGFSTRRPEDFPRLIIGWGRCRVGSTAMTNLFGIAGVPAHYQPVKTVARYRLVGQEGSPWHLPQGQHVLFAKEMAGPYVPYEALFNPAECLMAAGWPPDRLHLLVLDREPLASLDSWMGKWGNRIGRERVLQNFLLSTLNYERIRSFASRNGIGLTHFPYEASRAPAETVQWLFQRLGIGERFRDSMLTGWGAAGDLNSDAARIVYPAEPEQYVVPGIHGSGDAYGYRPREINQLTQDEQRVAHDPAVVAAYRTSVEGFCAELHVGDEWRQKLFAATA